VLAAPADDRFAETAHEVPLHGWALPSLSIFVADDDLCVVADAGSAHGAVRCFHAAPGTPSTRRMLFSSLEDHSAAAASATSRGRRLALEAFSNQDRSRGSRSRINIAVTFSDQGWDLTDTEVYDEMKLGARKTAAAYTRMSYGAFISNDSFATVVYTLVNTTYAKLTASKSAGELRDAAQWIVENHPDPARRLRFDDYDHQTVAFPQNFNAYSWAGLAQAPGSFGEPKPSARSTTSDAPRRPVSPYT